MMTKFKNLFQVLVVAVMLFGAMGSYQQAQAQSPAVVVVRDLTYWDATYTGYVDATRYEQWPVVFSEAEDFIVTAAPNADGLSTLVILKDSAGTELASGAGTLTSSQPAGSYFVQVQPATGVGFYSFTIRREEIVPVPTDPTSTTSVEPTGVFVGESAVVSVSLDNIPAEGYTSAEFTCTYDMSLVEVSNIVVTDLFGADSATAINGPAGGSFIVAVAGSNGSRATTDGVAFTFSAKGLAVGDAVIACAARVSKGDNLLTEVASTSTTLKINEDVVVVEDGTLTGQVFAGKAVTVELYDETDNLVATVVADVDGNFSLTAPAGTYKVVASASGFLGAEGSATLVANETATMPAVTLLAGDIDGNDVIDQFDAMTIGMSYNGADPAAADLNADGVINVLDLELLAANYRLTGPIAWQ
jgi:Carboxypeptidase regulatory-like domain